LTIILPYRESAFDGIELRFALRGISKYLTGFTNLILIGKTPDWCKVEWIHANDYPGRKQYSIYQKILTGLDSCTDDFVMFNDDHFLIKSIHVNDIKYWYEGTLEQVQQKGVYARYGEAIKNTLQLNPMALNFDIHTPIIYNKAKFQLLFANMENEVCIKSHYCNSFKVQGEVMPDLKIDRLVCKEVIKELIAHRTFFSIGSNGLKQPMIDTLNELYPEKSQWEK